MNYNPMFHNQVHLALEQEWGRKLTDHEKHLAAKVHDFVRDNMEVEEIRIVGVIVKNETNTSISR
jgi:hypothetical protein